MHAKEMASRLDISLNTLRYYLRIKLIKPYQNPENGYHNFTSNDERRLRFIITCRNLGFSISDIKEILSVADKGDTPCPTVRTLIEARMADTEKKFLEISALRKKMIKAISEWSAEPDMSPNGHSICHLIENFMHDNERY